LVKKPNIKHGKEIDTLNQQLAKPEEAFAQLSQREMCKIDLLRRHIERSLENTNLAAHDQRTAQLLEHEKHLRVLRLERERVRAAPAAAGDATWRWWRCRSASAPTRASTTTSSTS
jgi:hypothetical protein